MFRFSPFTNAFGIDISDLRLRLVQIAKSGRKLKVRCYNELTVPEGFIVDGEIKNFAKLVELLKQLVKEAKGGKVLSSYVIASLPERKTFFKVLDIPQLPEKEIEGAVQWGIEQNIPVSFDSVSYDWQTLSHDSQSNKTTIAVAAIPKEIPEQYSALLKAAKLVPIALETESNAIARALIDPAQHTKSGLIIIDLGASRTSLILVDEGVIHYSSTIELSGYEMTQTIARKFQLTIEQAEKAKLICGLDQKKGKGIVRQALLPLFAGLQKKTQEVEMFYHASLSRKLPLRVILCGGVSQMVGLDIFLTDALHLPVELGNPLRFVTGGSIKNSIPKEKILPYTTALGLALRPFLSNERYFI